MNHEQARLTQAVQSSTKEVFSIMMGLNAEAGEAFVEFARTTEPDDEGLSSSRDVGGASGTVRAIEELAGNGDRRERCSPFDGGPRRSLPAFEESGTDESFAGVAAAVGIGGAWTGTGTVLVGTGLALQATGAMLLEEHAAVDAEVLDVLAELTNMIMGSVKTVLEGELGPLVLGIPMVTYGLPAMVYGSHWNPLKEIEKPTVVVPFDVSGHRMRVTFCLVRQQSAIW